MQSTLLGLAIAVILALVTALVGPFFVDWTQYRGVFESEASRLIGLPVRVTGAIDARILPTPSVRLNGIEVGPAGTKTLEAKSLGIEFGLGPLIRGKLRAVEMHLIGPQVSLALDRNGAIAWPRAAGNFDPEAFAIETLNVEDGRAILTDANSGGRLVLDKFWFKGAVGSLVGPFKGEGAFVTGNALYGYRFSTGRSDGDGGLKIRLGIDASEKPLSIQADGMLRRERGKPRFEGMVTLKHLAAVSPARGQGAASDPWGVKFSVKADPDAALMEKVEFQYGPDERAIKLAGTAELKFGAHPRFTSVLSARQIDLDRGFAVSDATRRPPVAMIRHAARLIGQRLKPPLPVEIGIEIESMIIGSAPLQMVRGDLGFDGSVWTLDKFELRAPGYSQARFSGRLDAETQGMAFNGRLDLDTSDPRALVAWLEGRSNVRPGVIRPLKARGNVGLSTQKITIDSLHAEFDGEILEGRFAYVWPSGVRPARLDADLQAASLDIDGFLAFADMALSGTKLARPRELKLAIDLGQATIAGMVARGAKAHVQMDRKSLRIERLAVADLAGAAFAASGYIDRSGLSPRGMLTLDLDARELAGLTTLVAKLAPQPMARFGHLVERFAPARLHATLDFDRNGDGDGTRTVARLAANGMLAATPINLRSEVDGNLATWGAARLRLDGGLESDNASALVGLLGLEKVLAVGSGPGRLDVQASGPLDGALAIEGRLAAGDLAARAGGKLALFGSKGVTGALQVAVTGADARPLRPRAAGENAEAVPVSLSARVNVAGAQISFDELSARIADAPVRGWIALVAGTPIKIDGRIAAENVDAGAVIASAIGMPLTTAAEGELSWSSAPFDGGLFADLDGHVEISVARAVMARAPAATDLSAVIRFSPAELALEKVSGALAGGRLGGSLIVRKGIKGLTTHTQVELHDVDAAAWLPARPEPVLSGRMTMRLTAEGAGLSPQALVGSLAGKGMITLDDAQLVGVNPAVFAAVRESVDGGIVPEPAKVRSVVADTFDNGRLAIKHMQSTVMLSAGQARLDRASARTNDVELAVAGQFDLTSGGIDLRTTMTGPKGADASFAGRPDIFLSIKGTVAKPQRSIDVSALVGWLTLRNVERQARRLEAAEANRRAAAAETVVRPASPIVRPPTGGALSEARRSRAAASYADDNRSMIDRLRPEPSLPGGTTAATRTPASASPRTQAVPAIRGAPPLPAPIEVEPSPDARRALRTLRGPAANTGTAPDAKRRAGARPAPAGPSLDELLIRPKN